MFATLFFTMPLQLWPRDPQPLTAFSTARCAPKTVCFALAVRDARTNNK
jgi:hypothetical protein